MLGAVEHSDHEMMEHMRRWRKEAISRIEEATTEEERNAIKVELYR